MSSEYRLVRHDKDEDFSHEILELQAEVMPDDAVILPQDAVWFLLLHKGNPIAFGGIKTSVIYPKSQFLIRAGVRAAHTGHGLQRRLIRARLQYAIEETNAPFVHSYTIVDNVPSANNLIKCGFKLWRPGELFAGEEHMYFKKDIR